MKLRQAGAIAAAAATALALPFAAVGQDAGAPRTVEVSAEGNAFLGGLAFDPRDVRIRVGDVVRWRNTDFLVPHTSTEDHGLWDLGGNYGATPVNPSGYGPHTTVARRFEAGLHHYYCRVHPQQMHGTVAVPVSLRLEKVRVLLRKRPRRSGAARRRRRYKTLRYVVATWAPSAPAQGLVFDVQRRIGTGDWSGVLTGTTDQAGRFRSRKAGAVWQVRARLRRAGSQDKATGWSPVAEIRG